MAQESPVRRAVLFSGHVQGVGFRYTAQQVARGFAVTGFVRNTRDGRVELVAEGLPAEVEAFLAALTDRMSGHIREAQGETTPATGAFERFEVRH